jgi:ATP-dependent DNA helicase RecQ
METGGELLEALRTHFGYGAFRPGQQAIVESVFSGRPTIAILPTGGGKSLCYQLPALLLEGTTVVASPLVALMKDQVDALAARGISATCVNSSMSDAERQERQAQIRRGEHRLVYVAPERFRSTSFRESVAQIRVPLFAIDEAHCISSWGHDFRPDYLRLAEARGHLRAERVLALTATATPEVRADIGRALGLDDPRVFVAGFDRPNLFIEVARVSGDENKIGRLVALCRAHLPGLVYAATRRNVEKVVRALRAHGIDAVGYHAGMDDAERSEAQERFARGDASVVVATNAFGMGIDKSNIRFVAHFDVPRSIEAYYQEIGRAGRDGDRSIALLLFNFADVMLQKRMIEGSHPRESSVRRVWEEARKLGRGTVAEVAAAAGLHAGDVQSALRLLESGGHVERARGRESQAFEVATPDAGPDDLAVDFELARTRVAHERRMLDRMIRFVDETGCRRRAVLRYFGDPEAPRSCSACDVCTGPSAPAAEEVPLAKSRKPRAADHTPDAAASGDIDAPVFEALRSLRTQLARDAKVPPYVVFHDATLRALATALPQDERSFLAVKGAGPSRWQKYGERVLAVTAPAAAQRRSPVVSERSTPYGRERAASAPPQPAAIPMPKAARPTNGADAGAIVRLCDSGASLFDIARQAGVSEADVATRLCEAFRNGQKLDLARLLGADRLAAIRLAAQGTRGDVAAVRRKLSFKPPLAEIRLALLAN